MRKKPHLQIGQKGKGAGKVKRKRQQRPQQPYGPPSMPTNAPSVGAMPKAPPEVPNFLPNTPGFERAQTDINDARLAADTAYSTQSQMIPAQFNLGMARLDTDKGYATEALNEDLAERGIFDSSHRPYLYGRDVATPFGRGAQDLAFDAANAYSGLASQYGNDLLGGARSLYDAYLQRAADAYQAQPLSLPTGGYNLPPLPSFSPIYEPSRRAGKTRRKRKKGKK